MNQLPKKRELMEAIIHVLRASKGSMSTSDINSAVATYLKIPESLLSLEDSNCTGTEYGYRMRWARTELKQKGIISNIRRGYWQLT